MDGYKNLTKKEEKVLFAVFGRGPIEKELLSIKHENAIIEKFIDEGIILEIKVRNIIFLIISRKHYPEIDKRQEAAYYKNTRFRRETDSLIKTCLEDKPGVPF